VKERAYEIRVRDILGEEWREWFGGLTLRWETSDPENGAITILRGMLDQSALYGILMQMGELGLALVSVQTTPRAPTPVDPPLS
jgi:hypothetical protein